MDVQMFDFAPIFGLLDFPLIWLAIPLALAFSVTYACSREEAPRAILKRACKVAFWLFFFLTLIGVILYASV